MSFLCYVHCAVKDCSNKLHPALTTQTDTVVQKAGVALQFSSSAAAAAKADCCCCRVSNLPSYFFCRQNRQNFRICRQISTKIGKCNICIFCTLMQLKCNAIHTVPNLPKYIAKMGQCSSSKYNSMLQVLFCIF